MVPCLREHAGRLIAEHPARPPRAARVYADYSVVNCSPTRVAAPRKRLSALRRCAVVLVALLALCGLAGAASAGAATGDIRTVAGSGFAGFWGDGGLATSAGMRTPVSVASATDGTLYITDFDDNRVRKVSPTGVTSTFAGSGTAGYTGDGGAATSAQLRTPAGLAIDAAGAVYIADYGNHVVRKVSPGGTITRFAGTGTAGYSGNGGQARYAQLSAPIGLDFDAAGNLYIAEMGNHRVRKVTPGGVISTVAGSGATASSGDGGSATAAGIPYPVGIAANGSGTLYVSEFYGHRVRRVTTAGVIGTIAGTGVAGYSGNGGAATSATLNQPAGLDLDASGNLFVADFANHVVRRVTPAGVISRIAGTGQTAGYAGDGGQALSARLYNASGVTVNPTGHYYVADRSNHVVRRVEGLGTPDAPTLTATSPPVAVQRHHSGGQGDRYRGRHGEALHDIDVHRHGGGDRYGGPARLARAERDRVEQHDDDVLRNRQRQRRQRLALLRLVGRLPAGLVSPLGADDHRVAGLPGPRVGALVVVLR
jgi:sugar lactone lactonase YvrE